MAWTAPRTWNASEIVTKAIMDQFIRDNQLETAPAKAATAGYFIRVTGANAIEEADPTDGAKLDGDKIDIDWNPTNYTPDATPSEADDTDDLTAHLKGIDDELGVVANKNVWLYPASFVGTTSVVTFAERPVRQMGSSSADGSAHFSITLPSDFTTLVVANVWLTETTGGSVVVRYSITTNWGADGELPNGTTDSIAQTDKTMPATANELETIDISAAFTGIAAGDQIGIDFTRHGTHANDTANTVYLHGIMLEYN